MNEKLFSIFIIIFLFTQISMVDINDNTNYENSIESEESMIQNIPIMDSTQEDVRNLLANTPTAFTENHGQLENDEVRFYAQDGSVWFTDDGVWIELREYAEPRGRGSQLRDQGGVSGLDFDPMEEFREPETVEYKRAILKQEFVGANIIKPMGKDRLSWNSNFFYGNNSSSWQTEVPNYQEVYYENLYNGIDLRYYSNEQGLKYDFLVHPGADLSQIKIKYIGSSGLKIDESGDLLISTEIKKFKEKAPIIYQEYNGIRYKITGHFILNNNLEYGFEIFDKYDPKEILIIDPKIELEYSTFMGGNRGEQGYSIKVDSEGNAYVTGVTNSLNFPNTTGAFDNTYNGDTTFSDCFVFKIDPNGSNLIYSTYIGGNHVEYGYDITVNLNGSAYVTGWTYSSDFPTTPNAFDRLCNWSDVFVLKLAHNGSLLIYSTYVGGDAQDYGGDIAIDSIGNAYVAGGTISGDFPTTSSAFDTKYNGPDCFVFKLNHNGSDLLYSTFLGGINNEGDSTTSITIDSNGNAYIAGVTNSSDFPITKGVFDSSYNGENDSFVVKLNWNGSELLYSTFLGGDDYYRIWDLAIDLAGNAYVTGVTNSSNFSTTPDAFNRKYSGGELDAFVLKLNWNGSSLSYSTYIGGNNYERSHGITVDPNGNAFITGVTNSSDFPTTSNAYDRSCNGSDVFFLKLNLNGSLIEYSTFIGGGKGEGANSITLDLKDNIYITGETGSIDFPTTSEAYDRSYNGGYDIFVLKFSFPINITSVTLLKENMSIEKIYSRLCPYTFRVNITETVSLSDLELIRLNLDPLGTNIQLQWNSATNQFSKLYDPNNYVILEQSSKAYNNSIHKWTIDFNITFNWTYPDEDLCDVQAYMTSATNSPVWHNVTDLYRVENDLEFIGILSVRDENDQVLNENDLVRGGEKLNWTGLTTVYEGTTDVYPSSIEFDISIQNEAGNSWLTSPVPGENFTLCTSTNSNTDTDGDTHFIYISGIPPECDHTNTTFSVRIDGDNVSFSNHRPEADDWQRTNNVFVGVTITDTGGGYVNSSNVMQCISSDNGATWGAWEPVSDLNDGTSIIVQKFDTFEDGNDNLIKWFAKDSLDNGPTESEPYKVLVDTQDLSFSNAWPSANEESPIENVKVGITISDLTSGVNASKIKYTVSYDAGKTWDTWRSVPGFKSGKDVNIILNLTFPNGTDNRIKWHAYDIAGNGPVISDEYIINVNWIIPLIIPKVQLLSPENNSIISTSSIELSWMLNNTELNGVTYKVIVDTINHPIGVKQSNVYTTNFMLTELEDGKTYYWTIIPKLEDTNGSCVSGVWSFTVDIIRIKPSVTLISPTNGSEVQALKPTLVWSVNYEGTEELIYDIFLWKNNSIELELHDYHNTNYLSKNILEYNETYYWKVVPKAGGLEGFESETWWFTVKPKDHVPTFGIELILEPAIIEIRPGETRYVRANVSNLGEIADKLVLSIPEEFDPTLIVEINQPKIIEVDPDGIAVFNITIRANEDALEDEILISVVAASSIAAGYDQVVEQRATLTVKIVSQTKHDTGSSSDASWYWIILLIIFVIIIVLIIVGLIIKRKQKPEEEPAPGEVSTIESDVEVSQLPEIVPEVVTAAPITIPTVDTTVADSTPTIQATLTPAQVPGQTPQPQIPEAPEQAQLPPAQDVRQDQPNMTEQPTETTSVPGPPTEPQQIPEAPENPLQPPAKIEESTPEEGDDSKN